MENRQIVLEFGETPWGKFQRFKVVGQVPLDKGNRRESALEEGVDFLEQIFKQRISETRREACLEATAMGGEIPDEEEGVQATLDPLVPALQESYPPWVGLIYLLAATGIAKDIRKAADITMQSIGPEASIVMLFLSLARHWSNNRRASSQATDTGSKGATPL